MDITIVNIIQAMLAPGIMISACGLLLLSMSNKYSLTVARIRVLNDEKRKYITNSKSVHPNNEQEIRMHSVNAQLRRFQKRLRLVRDAVVFYTLAIAFFILSSLTIGLKFLTTIQYLENVVIGLFLAGMLFVLCGVLLAAIEVTKGYNIVQIEINDI